ncbi:hypothetical protein [Caulobacter sp. NIBR2454]|uniref:hypothetical protein n=1 Tax=Caulobacter sp. NIBR2454 TaxID=3015996 RepID=UPI0022B6C7A2|nr:hypothetical protein [Caulobacter sp. NIBR2454]
MSVGNPEKEAEGDSVEAPLQVPEVANEERSDVLTRILNQVRADALFARQWWRDRNPALAAPLEPVVAILSANNLVVSEGLGDAGFKSDPENFEVLFNANYLRSISSAVENLFPIEPGESPGALEEIIRQAVALYVFHEITHITQKFMEHELAATMKVAFSPDELSKIDLVADVRAAHCNALIDTAKQENLDRNAYLESYRNNLLLSYQLLVRAFSLKDKDHKKKRALGLLTNVVLTQGAITSVGGEATRRMELAVKPAFTSVDLDGGTIVALTCGSSGWEILFHGEVATNRMNVQEMWDAVGDTDTDDILAILRVAYEKLI